MCGDLWAISCVTALQIAILTAGADDGIRCAVLPLKGLPAAETEALRQMIVTELRSTGAFAPLPSQDVDRNLASRTRSAAGGGDDDGVADGRWLAVPYVISGRIDATGSVLRLRLTIRSIYATDPAAPLAEFERVDTRNVLLEQGAGIARHFAAAVSAARVSGESLPPPATLHLGHDVLLQVVRVPAGKFVMGEDKSEEDERTHSVRITRDFWMGRFEITNEQYQRFLDDTGYQGADQADDDYLKHMRALVPSASREPGYPVVCVSWLNAHAFNAWVARISGRIARLPTEAEWERACRAGTRTRYYTGDQDTDLLRAGWCATNGGQAIHPVGQLEPNAFGLYDMHGNAWEWCEDWYDQAYYAVSPVDDPPGPATGTARVLRGGSWFLIPRYCRSANRDFREPRFTNYVIGFRVVLM